MKRFAKSIFALGVAVLAFAACENKQEPVEEPVKYTLSGDNAFTNMEATVKVIADKAATADVQVTITLDKATSFPQNVLEFPGTVNIAKGAKEASAKVKLLSTDALEPGKEYKAVFGASVADVALTGNVTITYTKPDLNGKWSVIGLGGNWNDDIAMTEAGNGWYEATGLVAKDNDEFKFRRDGAWDLAYGLAAAGAPELDTEFAVTDAPGSPNIGIAAKGVYTLSVNPNAKLAKIVKTGLAPITLAEIAALATTDGAPFAGAIKDVVVTYVSGSNTFVTDGESNLLIYVKGLNLAAGSVLNGDVEGTVKDFNGLPEISAITSDFSKITVTEGTAPEPETMTVAQILANFDKIISKRVKVTGLSTAADIQKKGTYTVAQGTDEIKFYTYDLQNTIEAGSTFDVVGIVTPFKTDKQIKIFEEAAISNVVAPVKAPALEKVWEWKSSADALWTANVTAISITHPDGYGMARGLAMDDEYIYLPKSSGYAAIAAVKITDPTTQVKGNVTNVSVGNTFKTSFVRMMKNTDASVNGGKDVLIMSNLTNTNDANLVIYAYTNGIENEPVILAQFAWDSANNVTDWRRYGDRFYVTGTWQEGKIYLPSFNANKIVALSVANGARTAVEQYAAGTNSPDGIKDLTVYPGGNKLFLSNLSIANLVSATGNKSAQGWDEYVLDKASAKGVGTYGYNFFEFDGKKYIAYARATETSAQIEVIEDQGTEDNFVASIDAQAGLLSAAIQGELASGNTADCCVREIDGVVYIAALSRDGGLALYKLIMK